FWERVHGWHIQKKCITLQLFRSIFHKFPVKLQDLTAFLKRKICLKKKHLRTYFVKPEFKRSYYSKIPPSSTNCPKQIFIFRFTGDDNFTIGSDNFRRDQAVKG